MPAQKLTDRLVSSLRPDLGKRLEIMDSEATGLCLRVSPSGVRSWSYLYRPRGGGPLRRLTIGDYPAWSLKDARIKALSLRKAVQDGQDPVLEMKRAREALVFRVVLERFLLHARKRLRSADQYEALLLKDVFPSLGIRKAAEITRADIANLLDGIAERSPMTANRVQSVLSSAFSWAVNEGLLPSNPIFRLPKRGVEIPKERVLSDDEIRRLWNALEGMSPAYRDALLLGLLTAQRPGECAGITAAEVDLNANIWTIPAARSKNKREHAVPLVGRALAIVQALHDSRRSGRLIVTPRGAELTAQNLAKAFQRLPEGTLDSPATPHDLRRTAATILARLGIDRLHVGMVLNHASTTKASVTGSVYDKHSYLPEKRRALEALDAELSMLVRGVPAIK